MSADDEYGVCDQKVELAKLDQENTGTRISFDGKTAIYLQEQYNNTTNEVSLVEVKYIFNPIKRKFYKVIE